MKKARSKPDDSIHSCRAGRRAPRTAPGVTGTGGRGTRTAIGERDYTPRPEAPGPEPAARLRHRSGPGPGPRRRAARLLATGPAVLLRDLRRRPRRGPAPRAAHARPHGLRDGRDGRGAHQLARLP